MVPPNANLPLVDRVGSKLFSAEPSNKHLPQLLHELVTFLVGNARALLAGNRPFALMCPIRKLDVQDGRAFAYELKRRDSTSKLLDALRDCCDSKAPVLKQNSTEYRDILTAQRI